VTPYLTCYGKQRRHFEFTAIWRIRAVCLNLTLTYFNRAAIFKYGGLAHCLNYLNKTTML